MHPALHSLLTATRLCEIDCTLYAFLVAGGSLGSNYPTVCVVVIDAPFVMPKLLFCSCAAAILHSAFCPMSKITLLFLVIGGIATARGFTFSIIIIRMI